MRAIFFTEGLLGKTTSFDLCVLGKTQKQYTCALVKRLVRSGRRFGFSLTGTGIGDDFQASSGFISRPGVAQFAFSPSYTIVGRSGLAFPTAC